MTRPVTLTKSPRSTSAFQSARDSSPTSASDSITCSRVPESASDRPSCRVAKHSLPVLRMNTTRPATETTSSVSSPVARCAHRGPDVAQRVGPRHGHRVRLAARPPAAARASPDGPGSARGRRVRRQAGWAPAKGSGAARTAVHTVYRAVTRGSVRSTHGGRPRELRNGCRVRRDDRLRRQCPPVVRGGVRDAASGGPGRAAVDRRVTREQLLPGRSHLRRRWRRATVPVGRGAPGHPGRRLGHHRLRCRAADPRPGGVPGRRLLRRSGDHRRGHPAPAGHLLQPLPPGGLGHRAAERRPGARRWHRPDPYARG